MHKGIARIHSHGCLGPLKTKSLGDNYYFVTFVNDYSRRTWIYPIMHKYQLFEVFLKWKTMVENKIGRKIKILRSNNDGEYTSDPFKEYCQDEAIVSYFTVRGTTQQNRITKRMNPTSLENVRCMLSNVNLGKQFWAEALFYITFIVNRLSCSGVE